MSEGVVIATAFNAESQLRLSEKIANRMLGIHPMRPLVVDNRCIIRALER
jgi:hypothetical protein